MAFSAENLNLLEKVRDFRVALALLAFAALQHLTRPTKGNASDSGVLEKLISLRIEPAQRAVLTRQRKEILLSAVDSIRTQQISPPVVSAAVGVGVAFKLHGRVHPRFHGHLREGRSRP